MISIKNAICMGVAVFMLCTNASAMEDVTVGPMEDATVGPMEDATVGSMEDATVGSMENVTVGSMENVTVEPMENVTVEPIENVTVEPIEGGRNVSRPTASQGEFAAIIQWGAKLMAEKRFREAANTYTQAINANPTSDYGWAARGIALASMGPANYGQAWQDLSRAIKLNPRNDSAFLGRVAISRANHQDYSSDLKMAAQLGNRRAQQMLQYASTGGNTPQTMNTNQNVAAESSAPQATNPNQRGLSRQQIKWGCVIAGENIECPGRGSEYRHTFEIPQFGQVWDIYIAGGNYTTENRVDGTRTSHTYLAANLPNNNTLRIFENGTYLWIAKGEEIKGRWFQEDEHTLRLQKGYRGVDWRASVEKFGSEEEGRILVRRDDQKLAGRLRRER